MASSSSASAASTEYIPPQERIDTTGTRVNLTIDGRLQIFLDRRVKRRAFEQVLEYLYTDRVNWDKDTDRGLIEETKEAAQYFHIKRLEAICDQYLDSSKNVAVPESTWWKNMKWVFENLREGDFAMSDLTLICRGDGYDVPVPCHAIVLTAACKYFHGMLLGEVNNEEKKTMQIVVEEATEKQMLSILKYIYTREFDVDIGDVVGVWILANKFLLEDLQVECESLIIRNITKENANDIRKIAEMVQSQRVMELCDDVLRSTKAQI